MPDPSEHDLLFAVTAVQLRFADESQVERATGGSRADVRERLLSGGVISPGDAEAIDAVVRQRLSRSGSDAADAIAESGADATLAPSDILPPGDPFRTFESREAPAVGPSRFRVLRVHQEGGLGRVSVASDEEFKREIALKEILPDRADDPEQRRRFVREAEITGALEHPGVVPVYSLGEHADGRPYYAMRFIRGEDLQQASDDYHQRTPQTEQPLRFRQLLASFVDVCQTIDYAHSRGVIHRDLKPSNIMIGDYGESLVVDWGLAKASGVSHNSASGLGSEDFPASPVSPSGRDLPDATLAGKVVGTPAFMSPEQADGRIDLLTSSTDIYGLGATLYYLMTGRAPFSGRDIGVLRDVRQGRFAPPSELGGTIPKPLEAICLKAMARRQGDRYPTAGEMALDIERYLADQPVTAYREPLATRLGRWARNHRGLVLSLGSAASVALIALTAGVVLLGAANRRERAAREAATANAQQARSEWERAEQNFALARQSVQDYYVTVSEERLLDQPGMHPLRDALLRQALAYYQTFLANRRDDPSLQQEVARAYFNTARITETIDSPEAALPTYRRAIELQTPLAASEAAPGQATAALGRSQNALGRAFQKLRRLDQANEAFAEAAAVRRRVANADPANAEATRELANSLMNQAVVRLQQGDAAAALTGLKRAQALRLAHAPDPLPASGRLARDLAQGDYNQAAALLTLGNSAEALPAFERAADAFGRIASESPRDADNRARLANTLRMMAVVQTNLGEGAAAADAYGRAAEEFERLTNAYPDVVAYAGDLAGVRMNLAERFALDGETAPAIREIAAAVAALERIGPAAALTPRRQRDLGVALRFWGEQLLALGDNEQARRRLRESCELFRALVRDNPGEPADLDELAASEAVLQQLQDD